jgi:hypothetical protein
LLVALALLAGRFSAPRLRGGVSAAAFKKPVMAVGAASALKAKALDAAGATDDAVRHSTPPELGATAPSDPRVTTAQALAAVACSLENPESCEACQ